MSSQVIPRLARSRPDRNEPCACGSGRKIKNCCGQPDARVSGVAEGLMTTGRMLLAQGHRERAMDLLRERHERFPVDAEVGTPLAEELVEQWQVAEALMVVERVLAAHREHVQSLCVHAAAAVTLNPERDCIVKTHLRGLDKQPLAA
jgi:SEC-C motif